MIRKFYQKRILTKIELKFVPKNNETFWASKHRGCFHHPASQRYSSLIFEFSNLLNTKFYPCWFQGASKTNIILLDFLNVADVSSSHEHVFSYLSQGTCFKGNIASTAWKYVYHTFYFGFPFLYPVWNYHNQKCIQYHKCVWKGPTNVSMYCNNLAGVNC